MPLWKGCLPVTQCAFGYSLPSVLALTAYNLGFDLQEAVPNSKTSLLAYYEKDENGNFKRNGGTPNWVGFTGRALASTTLRNEAEYDVKFEKLCKATSRSPTVGLNLLTKWSIWTDFATGTITTSKRARTSTQDTAFCTDI